MLAIARTDYLCGGEVEETARCRTLAID